MVLLYQIRRNIYKIFAYIFLSLTFISGAYASETIRVLLPFSGSSINVILDRGKLYYGENIRVECEVQQDSDEISNIVNNIDRSPNEKLSLISSIDSKKSIMISFKKGIIINNSDRKYDMLLFKNESPSMEINGSFIKGDIEVRNISGTIKLINIIDVEDYLKYTVSKEMSPEWPIEALKAQTVLARTYVLKKKYNSRNCLYDIGNTTMDQVYGTYKEDSLEVIQAVSSTAGEVIKYNGEIIDALYHSCCGGRTSSSKEIFGFEKPYLVSVGCRCQGECPYGKGWSYRIEIVKLKKIFGLKKLRSISVNKDNVQINGDRQIILNRNAFRAKIGFSILKSSNYTIKTSGDEVIIRGSGFGHNVGLCQYGAKKMAEEGSNYRDILYHYFKGITIEKIY